MPSNVRLPPTSITAQVGLTGTLATINDDPSLTDTTFMTAPVNTATSLTTQFTQGSAMKATTQTVRVKIRKTNVTGNPTVRVEILNNGAIVATPIATTTVSDATGILLTGTFAGSLITGTIAVRVVGTQAAGGAGSSRGSLEVGSLDIIADLVDLGMITRWDGIVERPTTTEGVINSAGNLVPATTTLAP